MASAYIKSVSGIFKICQLLSNLVVLTTAAVPICVTFQSGRQACLSYDSSQVLFYGGNEPERFMEAYGQGFVIAVAILTSVLSILLIVVHHATAVEELLASKNVSLPFLELLCLVGAVVAYFIAFCVECWYADGYNRKWLLRLNDFAQWKACAAFTFLSLSLYIADAALQSIQRFRQAKELNKQPGMA